MPEQEKQLPEQEENKDVELMRSMRRCGHLLYHRYTLNYSQNRILLLLNQFGPMNQKMLMEQLGIQPGSLSETLSKQEQLGLIEKRRCEDDRRNCEITLTELGRKQAEEFGRKRKEMAEFLFAPLNDEQKEQLQDILSTLIPHWKNTACCEKENGHELT